MERNCFVMNKRNIAISGLMALALTASLFTGCGDGGTKKDSASSMSSGTASVNPENTFPITDEKTELRVWTVENAYVKNWETNELTTRLEERTNVHINWELAPSGEGDTKFNLSIASGNYPDIYTSMKFSTSQVRMCVDDGIFRPLDELIAQYGYNIRQYYESDPYVKESITAPDGNIYTLSYTDIGYHMRSQEKCFVLQEWLDNLGLEIPKTTEDFKNMLIAFRDQDANKNGDTSDEIPFTAYANDSTGWGNPMFFLIAPFQQLTNLGNKFHQIDDAGNVVFQANTEGFREGLRYIRDLYQEGLIAPETFVQDQTMLKALVSRAESTERLVGAVTDLWPGNFVDTAVMDIDAYVPVPPLEGPDGVHRADARNMPVVQMCGAITTQCQIPEVAIRYLDFWMSEEGSFALESGLEESKGYEVVEDGINFLGESPAIRPVRDMMTENYAYGAGVMPWVDTPQRRYSGIDDPENPSAGKILIDAALLYDPYAAPNNLPDISWADKDVSQKVSEYQTAFKEYILTASTQFIVGELSLEDDWDSYLANLETMGLSEYLETLAVYYTK